MANETEGGFVTPTYDEPADLPYIIGKNNEVAEKRLKELEMNAVEITIVSSEKVKQVFDEEGSNQL